MEKYDIIIVGAGIAGCGLAYNLSKECPEKKVLIIDKKELGANAAYGHRSTIKEAIKEYNLPFEKKYNKVRIGSSDKTCFTLNKEYYFVDYKKICNHLLKKSKIEFKQERAIKFGKKHLKTNQEIYEFGILVDCSGSSFFVKRICNQKLPFRYFVGRTKILKNNLGEKNYFYYHFNNPGYIEDLYLLDNKTIHGDWQYTKEVDFNRINPDEENLYKKYIKVPKFKERYKSVIPTTPVFPLVHKNIAFLGDSFGNAFPSSAFGIYVTLKSSKILVKAIKKQNLKFYEKEWKKNYLETYIQQLVPKYNTYHNSKFVETIKKNPTREQLLPYFAKYPWFLEKLFDCESNIKVPKEIKELFPRRSKIIQLYYYLYLKLKYATMQI